MLCSLSVTNFALVDFLEVDFASGFTTLTGKTGSGKSVILDVLKWISGEKTDVERLKEPQKSCVLEAVFQIEHYGLESFFDSEALDWAPRIHIRRVLAPNGKSRAFVQDLPVTQQVLKRLTQQLLDIHSQEQNFRLSDVDFQRSVIDDFSGLKKDLSIYQELYAKYRKKDRALLDQQLQMKKQEEERDYYQHQYDELFEAQLDVAEQAALEAELNVLSHAQSIKEDLQEVQQMLFGGEYPLLEALGACVQRLQKAESAMVSLTPLRERFEGGHIDLVDGARDIERLASQVVWDPVRFEEVTQRLNQFYSLQQKHRVTSTEALLGLQDDFEKKLATLSSAEADFASDQKTLKAWQSELERRAEALSQVRKKFIPALEKQILAHLGPLGMPHAQFEIRHELLEDLTSCGKDQMQYYFTGNAQSGLFPLEKVASGGEKARVMLAIKSILSAETQLPTILFDEIDIGVSGAIADRMGVLMQQMAQDRQVLAVTHLPQVAAKGGQHYCIFKKERTGHTSSHLLVLEGDSRVEEIAQMLSGSSITSSAREQARKLLGEW